MSRLNSSVSLKIVFFYFQQIFTLTYPYFNSLVDLCERIIANIKLYLTLKIVRFINAQFSLLFFKMHKKILIDLYKEDNGTIFSYKVKCLLKQQFVDEIPRIFYT